MQSTSNRRRLVVETLEGRSMLAGNISVSVVDGSLTIIGDDQANGFAIEQTLTNSFRVRPKPTGGEPTLINGVEAVFLTFHGVTNDINISVNGGADDVEAGWDFDSAILIPRNLVVDGGAGADDILVNANTGVSGRGGYVILRSADFVEPAHARVPKNFVATGVKSFLFAGLQVTGDAVISGTAGDDHYVMDGDRFGNLKINTFAGPDVIRLAFSPQITGNVDIDTGDGDDKVSIGSLSADNLTVNLAQGADEFFAWGKSSIGHEARIFGGEGSDNVSLEGFNAQDAFFVWLYSENDRLEIKNTVSPRAVLGGGPGIDTLILGSGNSIGQIDQSGFE